MESFGKYRKFLQKSKVCSKIEFSGKKYKFSAKKKKFLANKKKYAGEMEILGNLNSCTHISVFDDFFN